MATEQEQFNNLTAETSLIYEIFVALNQVKTIRFDQRMETMSNPEQYVNFSARQ